MKCWKRCNRDSVSSSPSAILSQKEPVHVIDDDSVGEQVGGHIPGEGTLREELGCSEEDPGHGQGTGRPTRVVLWSPVVSGKQ